MKNAEELVVITRTYDLILWSCNHTARFPRQHRFVLGERLERSLYDLLEMLIQAKYQRERSALLEAANLKLERPAGSFPVVTCAGRAVSTVIRFCRARKTKSMPSSRMNASSSRSEA